MKEVKLVVQKGGRVKILAEGALGKGTSEFTMDLANLLGFIVERHRGPSYNLAHINIEASTSVRNVP